MKKVPATASVEWYKKGWKVFTSDVVTWLILAVIFIAIAIVLTIIPLIGGLVYNLVLPALMGGMLLAVKESLDGGKPQIEHLFTALMNEKQRTPMLILGAILLAASVIMGILGMGSISGVLSGGGMSGLGLFSGLLMLIVSVLIGAAFFYAPAQVMFKNTAPVDAIKNSLSASLRNAPALLVFGLIYIVLTVIASIPFGLGFLVLIPVVMGALYASFRDIF